MLAVFCPSTHAPSITLIFNNFGIQFSFQNNAHFSKATYLRYVRTYEGKQLLDALSRYTARYGKYSRVQLYRTVPVPIFIIQILRVVNYLYHTYGVMYGNIVPA